MKTLLLSQRVNTHWQDTTSSSTKFQKRLLLIAATTQNLYSLSITKMILDGFSLLVGNTAFNVRLTASWELWALQLQTTPRPTGSSCVRILSLSQKQHDIFNAAKIDRR